MPSEHPFHFNLHVESADLIQLQVGNAAASMSTAAAPPLGVRIAAPTGLSVAVASSQRWTAPDAPLSPSPPTSKKLWPNRTVEAP